MPNIKSAKTRLRRNARQRVVTAPIKTRVRTARRHFMESVSGEGQDRAQAVSAYCSCLDKAAKSGVIKKNTAIRRKSRAAEQLRKAEAASA